MRLLCKKQEFCTTKRRLENQLLSWCRNPVRMSAFEQSPQVGGWIRNGDFWRILPEGRMSGVDPERAVRIGSQNRRLFPDGRMLHAFQTFCRLETVRLGPTSQWFFDRAGEIRESLATPLRARLLALKNSIFLPSGSAPVAPRVGSRTQVARRLSCCRRGLSGKSGN